MARSLNSDFPFATYLSLEGLIGFWSELARDEASPFQTQAKLLVERVEAVPGLRGRIEDEGILARHGSLVEALMAALFPVADQAALGGTGRPFGFTNIYETPRALETGLFSEESFVGGSHLSEEEMQRGQMVAAYQCVLRSAYGIAAELAYPLLVSLEEPETGLQQHYQLWWDPTFIEVVPRGGALPRPSEAEFKRLLAEPTNIPLWMEVLPPSRFELGGLGVVRGTDVTQREAISRLKDDLLKQGAMSSPERIDQLQHRIRTLLGAPEARLGMIAFDYSDGSDTLDGAFPVGRSLLMSDGVKPECPQSSKSHHAEAFKNGQPVVVPDLEHAVNKTGFEYHLMEQGLKSLLVQPLFSGNQMIGLLEVASPHTDRLSAFSSFKLSDVAQPFAIALERSLSDREDRLQAIIKRQYTAIHPSVEWRFRDAAARILDTTEDAPTPEQVVFPDVYPLYGLTDIRGSSGTRSRGIQADLVEQLQLALQVLDGAGKERGLPVLDQIGYRIRRFLSRIEAGLHSEDETAAIGFLHTDFEPLLDGLGGWGPDVAAQVEVYQQALDPELGVLYHRRRRFDQSVMKFNETISQVLEREQLEAQAVFPHFFERFQTDGVDYNIYIGDSLTKAGGFQRMYLHNLRLWQLKLVSHVEWELNRTRPELGVDLAPTHLVLVQDQPLSIRFRIDEKRFDVDGAYNIRYELVKKRIDKAHIRKTNERLTQPGYLAVVYSQAHEAHEYRRYLEYLISIGYYDGAIEDLELEDLQGVLGLRALRVAIPSEAPSSDARPTTRVEGSELARVIAGA